MSGFFKPYEGSRPFLFISYAHRQSDAVLATIRILHEQGWRLWYDEGIPAGSDWPTNIARHMQDCERVVFFLSARALESHNCYSEMKSASRLGKPILIVRLEDAAPDEKWKDILAGCPEIPLLQSAGDRADAILRSGFLPRRLHRSRAEHIPWRALGLIASLLLFLASAGALAALAAGRWTPFPPPGIAPARETSVPTPIPTVNLGEAERYFTVSFPDALQDSAVRAALGIPEGPLSRSDLAGLKELYLAGNLVPDMLAAVAFDADGVCRVNGAPVIQGPVSDLRSLRYAMRLEKLGLICQPLGDLSPLNALVLLRELSLAGSSVDDLAALKELPSLETLHLEHTGVRDLTPLDALSNLKTVTVSRDMLPLTWSKTAAFAVVLVRDS